MEKLLEESKLVIENLENSLEISNREKDRAQMIEKELMDAKNELEQTTESKENITRQQQQSNNDLANLHSELNKSNKLINDFKVNLQNANDELKAVQLEV